jgi:2-polyprenyl-6-methoxyphenol hydroxylase-like FAD-dependent oxidoreductase
VQHDPILIAGAGPTGLVLALSLRLQGARFRIIDAAAGPGEQSRATVVQARTLEFYRQFGIADAVLAEGIPAHALHLRRRKSSGESMEVLQVDLKDSGQGISPYPFTLSYPQDFHERLLVRELSSLGVEIEWNTRLDQVDQDAGGVWASLTNRDGSRENGRFSYVCGCDGAHSKVRESLGLKLLGGTYDQPFYVADVQLSAASGSDLFFNVGDKLLALMMPVRVSGTHRLIGLVPPELAGMDNLAFSDLQADIEDLIGVKVRSVNWFSRYRVHHRVANHFRAGRAFLLGDAGHIHSPVAGQGMNTGIGDAVNLGWKLAAVWCGRARPDLLDSYETERIGFARALVRTTDRVFSSIIASDVRGQIMRRVLVPVLGRLVSHARAIRRLGFRTVSQTQIRYPQSPLSQGKQGEVSGGDRLPWLASGDGDNFEPLGSLSWQVHVYGTASSPLREALRMHELPLHVFGWTKEAEKAGFARDAIYLVRPDGHVGLAANQADLDQLASYIGRHVSVAPVERVTSSEDVTGASLS